MRKKEFVLCFFCLSLFLLGFFCCKGKKPALKADLVLLNGKIVTLNSKYPQAEALAIKGNIIARVGRVREIESLIGDETRVIDLKQKLVIPGFIDAHIHPFGLGSTLAKVALDLSGLSKEKILEKVSERVKEVEKGVWIRGRGWDQAFFKDKEFLTRYELDAVSPDNPVALIRIDGHSGCYNSLALKLYNIDRNTKDPEGGKILKDSSGEPTGMLIDKAMELIKFEEIERGEEEKEKYFRLAMEQFKKWGVTGIHDAGADRESIKVYEKLRQNGELTVRVYAMISAESEAFEDALKRGPLIDNFFTARSIKMLIDGALGSRGALLFEPYSDSAETQGLQMMSEGKAYEIIKKSLEKGFQVCTHAIGDKAVNMMLDLYQKGVKEIPVKDHRLRIEHASVINAQDIPRFRKLKVIASMQPVFIGEYGRWSEDRLGKERVRGVLPFRRLLDEGVLVAGGTDCPACDSGNPLINFYCAVTRKSPYGVSEEWYGEEKVGREEALRMLTLNAAYASFEEKLKGSLEEGKLADLVVLSKDIRNIDEEEILNTEVLMTILDGKIIYSK